MAFTIKGKARKLPPGTKVWKMTPKPTLTRKVKTLSKKVAALTPESKHYDVFDGAITVLNNIAVSSCLFPTRDIAEGTGDFGERIGDKLRIISYNLRMNLILTAGVTYDHIRIAVVQFKHNPDAATTQLSFINEYWNSATDNSARNVLAVKDWDNNDTFRILYDKVHTLRASVSIGSTPAAATTGKYVNLNLRLPNVAKSVTYFNGTNTPSKNEIFVVFQSLTDVSSTIQYTSRFVYTDV